MTQRIEMVPFADAYWPATWSLLRAVFADGDSFPQAPDIDEAAARRTWLETPTATYTALLHDGETATPAVAGGYYIKPNQPTLGAHVCNCGYAVAPAHRGLGVASAMCRHSQKIARALGFRAMQYNLVVSTNTAALRLWQKHGFAVVGTLPNAFQHRRQGYVDACVLYKELSETTD